jgi:hypothetical protein
MSIAAKNKSGADYQTAEGLTLKTPDGLAAFSIVGNIVGILVALFGLLLGFTHRFIPLLVAAVLLLRSSWELSSFDRTSHSGSFSRE